MTREWSPRFPNAVVQYVRERLRDGVLVKEIQAELQNLVKQSIVEHEGTFRENPLYQQPVPDYKTLLRWRIHLAKPDHSTTDPGAAEKWHSGMEENPDDARVILSVLAEVVNHSRGHRNHFNKVMAGQVLRVTKLAPGIPPYLAWLLGWNYFQAQQDEDTSTREALDLFLGLRPWEKGQDFSNYKHLVEMGRITPVPSELLEEMEEVMVRRRALSRAGVSSHTAQRLQEEDC